MAWRSIEDAGGIVRLDRFVKLGINQAVYAMSEVTSPAETDAALMANADDGIRVWVSGELAATKSEHHFGGRGYR